MFDELNYKKEEGEEAAVGREGGGDGNYGNKGKKADNRFIAGNIPPRENISLSQEIDLAKIGPQLPPLDEGHSEDFENRMRSLHEKGKKRGLKFSLIGLIGGAVITAGAIYFVNSFKGDVQKISNEINRQDREPVEAAIDPENICDNDYCCLASLRRIINNGYLKASWEEACPAGHERQTLECVNSLYWCAPAPDTDIESEPALRTDEYIPDADYGFDNGSESAPSSKANEYLPDEDRNPADGSESEPASKTNGYLLAGDGTDSDNDGLSDYEEINVWGTDPQDPDSDKDGFFDGAEAKSGYNPLGEGML